MDFVNEKPVGQDIRADFDAIRIGAGYDHCWVIDGAEPCQLQFCCELYAPESGRTLNIYTTQPGVQVYTGNWLEGCPEGKNGHVYNNNDGIAIECQNYPDGPNKADYPNCILRPGEVFEQATRYNAVVGARYLILSNGLQHFCFERSTEGYTPLRAFPRVG